MTGTPGTVNTYDAAGNVLCSGTQGADAKAYVWDAENRLSQTWAAQNSSTNFTASYLYGAGGRRVRADQMVPGTSTTQSFREYISMGGQTLAEKDQAGIWTDYIYANGKRVASSTNADTRIRLGGTTTKIGGEGYANIFFPQAYVIRTGDRISWRQYNQNAVGGLNVGFTNGTWTGWHLQDTAGQDSNQDWIENVWQYRTAVLNDYVGLTTNGIVLVKDVYSPVGDWSMLISDIAIYSADGSVQHAYSGEQESLQIYGIDPAYNSSFTAAVEVYPIIPDANTTKYYLSDQLGTTQMEFAGGGWPVWKGEFAPFGQELDTQATANRYKFTGKERDAESGLDNFEARYYGSNMGRFMSPDFTGVGSDPVPVPSADFENPQSLNLYSYVHNSPLVNVDPDGHDCVVQTRTSETTESVSVSSGNCDNVKVGDGQTKSYVAGTVTSISGAGSSINVGYTPYTGGGDAGVANLNVAPTPDRPGLAYNYGNNAQGYQMLGAADKAVTYGTYAYAGIFGSVGAVIAGGEIAAGTAAARSQIIFRLAHGMRIAAGHSQVLADVGAVKNAIAAAVASGAVTSLGGNAFQGVVNVAGTYIRFTGATTPAGTVISNVMGAALQR